MKHKLWTLIGVAFVVYFVITNPHGAAATVRAIGSGLAAVGSGFGSFFTALSGGGR